MKLFQKISENQFEITDSLLDRLEAKIKKKYPYVQTSVSGNADGELVLDVDTGETNFYISQISGGKFSVNAVWPSDEKGKKNLDADAMVKAVSDISGMT